MQLFFQTISPELAHLAKATAIVDNNPHDAV